VIPIDPEHLDKLLEFVPDRPKQRAVGDSPRAYLDRLNEITQLDLNGPPGVSAGAISRGEIQSLAQDNKVDSLVLYAAVMGWGGRGKDSRNYRTSLEGASLKNLRVALDQLRNSRATRQQDFADIQKATSSIRGLGISFYTKLLYFLRQQRAGDRPAYILDQFTAKSARLLFLGCPIQLTAGGYPHPDTKPADYEWFCAALEALGRHIDPQNPWTGEQVEIALFDERSGDWRKYVRSFFAAKSPQRARSSSPDSLPSPTLAQSLALAGLIAAEHLKAYSDGTELPPLNGSVTATAKINCGNLKGLNWQYVVIRKEVRAAVYIPSSQRARYDALRKFLGVRDHEFGDGIRGTGFKDGRSCTLSLPIPRGSQTAEDLARQAVAGMSELFTTVAEII
jgi:hypothetical protein